MCHAVLPRLLCNIQALSLNCYGAALSPESSRPESWRHVVQNRIVTFNGLLFAEPGTARCDLARWTCELSVCHGSKQGSDARDSLLGRLFGCAAVIRSGRVADAEIAMGVASRLLSVAAAKSFLREAATAVLLELLEGGAPDAVTAAVLAGSPELRGVLQAPPAESDPEVRRGG